MELFGDQWFSERVTIIEQVVTGTNLHTSLRGRQVHNGFEPMEMPSCHYVFRSRSAVKAVFDSYHIRSRNSKTTRKSAINGNSHFKIGAAWGVKVMQASMQRAAVKSANLPTTLLTVVFLQPTTITMAESLKGTACATDSFLRGATNATAGSLMGTACATNELIQCAATTTAESAKGTACATTEFLEGVSEHMSEACEHMAVELGRFFHDKMEALATSLKGREQATKKSMEEFVAGQVFQDLILLQRVQSQSLIGSRNIHTRLP